MTAPGRDTIPYERRYTSRNAKVAHAVGRLSGNLSKLAVCGRGPAYSGDWYGSGDQLEYERAATLPRCRHCELQIGTDW